MKKNTWIILGVFAALLAAVLFLQRAPEGDTSKALSLPILKEAPKPDEAKPAEAKPAEAKPVDAKDEKAPAPDAEQVVLQKPAESARESLDAINLIEIVRQGETLVLEKLDKDTWQFSAPKKAAADTYKVQSMLKLFTSPSESVFSTPVADDKDLRYYGLDEKERLGVTLKRDGVVWLKLAIGNAQGTEEEGSEKDTFVQHGDDGWIYRIQGKDLRQPFDHAFDELRSKKLFSFKKEDVTELRLASTVDARYPEAILKKDPVPDPSTGLPSTSLGAGGAGGADPKAEETWTLVKPEGFKVGSPSSYLSTLANLYVTGYADKAPAEAKLDTPVARVTVVLKDGASHTLVLAGEAEDSTWVQVEGSAEVAKVSKYTGQSLKKSAMDFRDKKILGLDEKSAVELHFGDVHLTNDGDHWTVLAPVRAAAGDDEVQKVLKDLGSFAIDAYVSEPVSVAETGLNANAYRFLVRSAAGTVEVLLGTEKDGKVYGTVNGSGEVWLATSYNANKLKKKVDDLRRHRLFQVEATAFDRIELTHPDQSLVLEQKRPQGSPGELTTGPWALTKPADAGALDQSKLDSIPTTLAALTAKDIVADKDAPTIAWNKAFKLTWKDEQGTTRTLWISDDKKDGNSWAKTDDPDWAGHVVTLQPFQVNKIKKKVHELVKGE